MKGTVRIGGALAVGIIVILGALYVKNTGGESQTGTAIVARAPERTYIETKDANSNGVSDWEESLQDRFVEIVQLSSSTQPSADEPYTPPTTLTGKFSEAFFQDYLQGKINGEDFSDPTELVNNAVTAVEQSTKSKRHSRIEFRIVPSTEESLRMYGNQIAEVVKNNSVENENEAKILERALQANNPEILKALDPIHTVYTKIIADTLALSVPDEMADEHMNLLNAYEAILTDIEAMQVAFTDPLYALARVKEYQKDAMALFTAYKATGDVFTREGITYANDELGSFFYLFDT